ncbi:hypothetical protein [Demequina aurantiaca]|uniref:hypothetical protein n=1 Tax=Demequina aurantiaca TaxID=676200 RepID=UPI003D3377EB
MKIYRIPAAAAAIALGLSASVAIAFPAAAADNYVVDGDISTEGDSYPSYPDATWFTGNPQPAVAPAFTEDGLVLTGQTQLLYGDAAEPITGDDFIALVAGAAVVADGTWNFQIPVFFDGETPDYFTTFRPTAPNTIGDEWITSQDLPDFDAGSTMTTDEIAYLIDDAIEFGLTPVVLAHGVFVDEGSTATVKSITWAGNTSFFTPESETPVATPSPEAPVVTPPASGTPAPPASAVEGEATFTG